MAVLTEALLPERISFPSLSTCVSLPCENPWKSLQLAWLRSGARPAGEGSLIDWPSSGALQSPSLKEERNRHCAGKKSRRLLPGRGGGPFLTRCGAPVSPCMGSVWGDHSAERRKKFTCQKRADDGPGQIGRSFLWCALKFTPYPVNRVEIGGY